MHVDTGLLQPVISFIAEHKGKLDALPIVAAISGLTLPRILLYVHARPELALSRYLARDNRRIDGAEREMIVRQFSLAAAACEQLVQYCRGAGAIVFSVDAEETRSDAAAERVADELSRCIESDIQ
jgi:hypothetical protein